MNRLERIKGCLLGGAVGDALGAAVEFLEWSAIEAKFGPQGIVDFAPAFGTTGAITDDTQMMLFTAEGLLRAYVCGSSRGTCHVPSIIHHSLLRWLITQDYPTAMPIGVDGWLIKQSELWSRRAPGTTCLGALKASPRLGAVAENNSKGCGALMRVAPCAFFANAFDYAAQSGRLTHGHPTGYLAAGLFADILQRIVDRQDSLEHALTQSLAKYGQTPGTLINYQVEAVLYLYPGPEIELSLIEAKAALERYINTQRRLGRDIRRSAIHAALHVSRVQRVELIHPSEDVVVADNEAANCMGFSVVIGGTDE
ncbi:MULTISPECIES: ADP-ribosylglycohydrolase family protein [unclassified Pseudomonas]|uniref:ADP-ribosylglycohydrolase family protein n=1 Tax=unclassified Pseudomonas TaxID=196821 RepID=UPI0021143209|nr:MULTISPECIES: ADP-ribosylglycohydrolase family protein [unclassified Pseudomonas]